MVSNASAIYPFQTIPGLLSPQGADNVKSQTMESMAAGLLNSAGYSSMPHSIFQDLGKGVASGLQGYQQAQNSGAQQAALQQSLQMQRLQLAIAQQKMGMLLRYFGANSAAPTAANGAGSTVPPATAAAPGGPPPITSGPVSSGLLAQGAGQVGPPLPPPGLLSQPPAGNGSPVPSIGVSAGGGALAAPAAPIVNPGGAPPAATPGGIPRSVMQANIVGAFLGAPGLGQYAAKAAAPTDAEKDARDPAVAAYNLQQAQMKNDVARYGKEYTDAITQGQEAATANANIEGAQSVLNAPGFYSGAENDKVLAYRKLLAAIGGDPNAAAPQEEFRNLNKESLLSTIRSMKGTGRIMKSELQTIQSALANPDNSVSGNRTVLEIQRRLNQRQIDVANLARTYNGGSGHLDAGYDRSVANVLAQPLFSKAEMKDPRLIAPPTFANPQQMLNAGLPSGTPVRSPDGGLAYVP
jgi:hypothetical protein